MKQERLNLSLVEKSIPAHDFSVWKHCKILFYLNMEVGTAQRKHRSSRQEVRGGGWNDKVGEVDVRKAKSKGRNVRCITAIERVALRK